MGDRRYIPDTGHNQASPLQRPNGGFPAGSRPLDQYIYLAQSLVHPPAGSLLRGPLGGKGRTLAGPFETHGSRAGRRDHAALRVGDANQGVVERRIYISPALYNCSALSTSCSWSRHKFLSPTSYHPSGGHVRQQCGGALSGYGRWSGCAGHGPAGRAGGADLDRNQFRLNGECFG